MLPEETARHYDLPSDSAHVQFLDPLYSSVANTYTRDPALRDSLQYAQPTGQYAQPTDPLYAEADDLYELYEDDSEITPNSNTYVETNTVATVTLNNSDVYPNR